MTSRDFCYWLQGFFELRGEDKAHLSQAQVDSIRAHLALVFVHEIDPSAGGPVEQEKLNAVHAGVSKEELESAIKEAIAKIPRPPLPGGMIMRC